MRPLRLPGLANPERGVALIIVLIILSMLLAVVGEFGLAMRLEATTTLNFRAAVAAGYLAEAAYYRAIAEILPDALAHTVDEHGLLVFRSGHGEAPPTPTRQDVPLGSGRFSYRITDEESRLNLNRLRPDVLRRLLTELGVERETRDVIVDSILDWIDPNEEHRLNGAESDDHYLTLPVPYRAKNAPFDSVDELLQVRGVTRDIFYGRPESPGLAEYVTVAGSGRININTASDTVLRTLGLAQAEVDLCKASRPYLNLVSVSPQCRRVNPTTRSDLFRIEARGELPGQGRRTLSALVQRRAGRDGIVQATPLEWRWDPETLR